jgi:CelD/BcsL family acetyltransferase involved in cellulose biosynthesis
MINIRIFDTLVNPRLKASWEELYFRNNYCFQNSYTWCSLWWKNFHKSNWKPLIVIAEDSGQVIGLGPFMIEKKQLFTELKFIGSGLTDFHEILTLPTRREESLKAVLNWALSKHYYDLINLEQISDGSTLYEVIREVQAFKAREMVKCPVVNLKSLSWEEYLRMLPSRLRWEWSKKHRDLNRKGRLQFIRLESAKDKSEFIDKIFKLHVKRWEHEQGISKFIQDKIRAFISELVMVAPEMILYALLLDDRFIAYQLGFSQKDVFYDWNKSYDPEFSRYSVGNVLMGLILKDLIEKKFQKYNQMRGDYQWKRRWMTDEETVTNYQFLAGSSRVRGYLGERYYLEWKWWLKNRLKGILRLPIVQKLALKAKY